MKLLTTTRELRGALNDDALMVFDCRFSLADADEGQKLYRQAHIPGAQHADLNRDLSDLSLAGGRHPLPARDAFVATVRKWGIGNNSQVVCYDDGSHSHAARLWWMLRWLGHAGVTVLDGGMAAWVERDCPLDATLPEIEPSEFQPGEPLTRIRHAGDILSDNTLLLDARDGARFRGETEPLDPVAGHIPGARCASFTENMTHNKPGGRFLLPDQLRRRFERLGVTPGTDVTCYCGSGVTATNNIMALLLAGYEEPALYPGSWSDWITDPDRTIETG